MSVRIELLVWLPPLLFILHDMEEIIFGMAWKKREPNIKKYVSIKFVPFGTARDAAGFSACVYEELLILTAISLFSSLTGHCGLWFGMMAANCFHLIVLHIVGGSVVYRAYVPGLVTACITVLPCIWVLLASEHFLHYSMLKMLAWIFIGIIVAMVNLHIMHKFADKIGSWIQGKRGI